LPAGRDPSLTDRRVGVADAVSFTSAYSPIVREEFGSNCRVRHSAIPRMAATLDGIVVIILYRYRDLLAMERYFIGESTMSEGAIRVVTPTLFDRGTFIGGSRGSSWARTKRP